MYILIVLTNQRALRATLSTLVSHDFIVVNTVLSRSCISLYGCQCLSFLFGLNRPP